MPLDATRMVNKGHLIHDDVKQFYDLLTGVMADQRVEINNDLYVDYNLTVDGRITCNGGITGQGLTSQGTNGLSVMGGESYMAGKLTIDNAAGLDVVGGALRLQSGATITGNGAVPAGGAVGQVLSKSAAGDYALAWQTPATGVTWPLLAPDGSAAAPSYSFANNPGNGMYSNGGIALGFATGGTFRMFVGGSLSLNIPIQFSVDNTVDIGAVSSARPRNVYVGSTIVAAGTSTPITIGASSSGAFITGAIGGSLMFGVNGNTRWVIDFTTGRLQTQVDNSYDIGAAGANRPRNVYVAGILTAGEVDAMNVWTTSTILGFGDTTNGTRWRIMASDGSFQPFSDNAYDIGASANRVRNLYIAGGLSLGSRINGDMTSTPTINRLSFVTSVPNSVTVIQAMPSGTGNTSALNLSSVADPDNASLGQLIMGTTAFNINSGHSGTGVTMPMWLSIDGTTPVFIIRTDGNVIMPGGTTDVGDPNIRLRVRTDSNQAHYGFQHVDATPNNVFYTRNDGYTFIKGPLQLGDVVAHGQITFPNTAYISTYTSGSDIRIAMPGLTVTPGITSTATLNVNGQLNANGHVHVTPNFNLYIDGPGVLYLGNQTIQYCSTIYGKDNAGYITNDSPNSWTVSNHLSCYGVLSCNGDLHVGGHLTLNYSAANPYAIIANAGTGSLYIRSGSGTVIMDSGSLTVSAGNINGNSFTSPNWIATPTHYYNAGATGSYIQQAGASLRYFASSGGYHSFEGGGQVTCNAFFQTNSATWRSDGVENIFCSPAASAPHWMMTAAQAAWATVNAAAFTPASARKYKTDIRLLTNPLDMLLDDRVHAVRYTDIATEEPKVGFIADDWLGVLPEVVDLDNEGDVMALDYDRISAVTFEALKQHVLQTNARLAVLEAKCLAS